MESAERFREQTPLFHVQKHYNGEVLALPTASGKQCTVPTLPMNQPQRYELRGILSNRQEHVQTPWSYQRTPARSPEFDRILGEIIERTGIHPGNAHESRATPGAISFVAHPEAARRIAAHYRGRIGVIVTDADGNPVEPAETAPTPARVALSTTASPRRRRADEVDPWRNDRYETGVVD